MKLEERVASAVRAQTESLVPPPVDISSIRSAARAKSRRRAAVVAAAAVAVVLVVVASGAAEIGRDRSDRLPLASPPPSPTSSVVPPIDTTSWTTYTSDRYDLQVGHPADWTVVPATRDWSFDTDAADPLSPAYESFVDPSGDVRVSVWEVPLSTVAADAEPARTSTGTTLLCEDLSGAKAYRQCVEEVDYMVAWVDDYCKATGITKPCDAIQDHAIELCLEQWDCHPGVMVPFESAVQAFFSGGIYSQDSMTVVTVWRGESDPSVERYGGAQRLLEQFLTTMQVWPASTPRANRTVAVGLD